MYNPRSLQILEHFTYDVPRTSAMFLRRPFSLSPTPRMVLYTLNGTLSPAPLPLSLSEFARVCMDVEVDGVRLLAIFFNDDVAPYDAVMLDVSTVTLIVRVESRDRLPNPDRFLCINDDSVGVAWRLDFNTPS